MSDQTQHIDVDAALIPAREVIESAIATLTSELDARRAALAPLEEQLAHCQAVLAAIEGKPTTRRSTRRSSSSGGGAGVRDNVLRALKAGSPMTAPELADATGATRAQVSSALQSLKRSGSASNDGGTWTAA